jgi:hypothetical protein
MVDPEGMRDFLSLRMRGSQAEKAGITADPLAAVLHEIADGSREIQALMKESRA